MLPEWVPFHRLSIPVAFLLSFVIVWAIDRPRGRWGRRVRSRLLRGVPWGTLVAVGVVLLVYLFVQRGIDDPSSPVVIPFRAWSYFSLDGLLLSGLSHASLGHLTGNLLATLVAGTLAEYAYGHYPRARGASSFASWRSNPYVRAFLVVPAAIVGGAVLSSVIAVGPVIGFSGVVFALWGVAIVHYPLGSIVALAGTSLVNLLYSAFTSPVTRAAASPSYGGPWWANISIQGHAVGFLLGVLVGIVLLRRCETDVPSAAVVFAGVLLFASSRSLWAVYWYLGNERYVLYRAVGVALVALLAAIVTLAVAGSDRPLRPEYAVPNPETMREALRSATPRIVGVVLVVAAFGILVGPSVVPNLVTVPAEESLPGDPVEVEGYEVTYAEDVPNQLVNVIDVEAFEGATNVTTSGVIVKNAERDVWITAVSRGNLAYWGSREVTLGGIGWRETVTAHRTGWRAVGAGVSYRVDLEHDGDRRTVHVSDSATAEPTIDGRNVTVSARQGVFEVTVANGTGAATAPLPAANESVRLSGIRLVREDRRIYAETNGTRVRVLEAERYEGRERAREVDLGAVDASS
ncbi:Membrane associated serine protease, rhomboid family [Halopenitus malekzadehii]|uniref:Membrane associated serine protease, rhomboid family n=1 Tax=Halopenitus malekzadehii TaxID=1267564 RepID=A0A1H6I216_9EURY|nr:rhomboid family intramembrane serine protease [Halopenitus malekzadehii]SEH41510.1 Membrane associated serine protease, rhomboid family [Halopenitus malekzadehii]